jgi:hypothetical protein
MGKSEAEAAKKAGMQQVEEHANELWMDEMLDCVQEVCRDNRYFTADHVFILADARNIHTTHDLRAFGPVMLRAAKQELCCKANVMPVNSIRRSLHASPITVWESLIWKGTTSGGRR